MFTPVQNVARFELVYTHNDVICENVFHVESAVSTWTSSELADTATRWTGWWNSNIKPLVSSATSLVKIIATALTEQTSPKIEYVTGLPIVGTGTGTPLPGNVTLSVKFTTGNRGRSARGRCYHVGLCEEQVTGNLVDESVYTALLTAYQQIPIVINVNLESFRVVSLYHNKLKRESGATWPITGVSINKTIDTQRRRLV